MATMEDILNGPLLPAPEGFTSQLDNPPNNNGLALAVLIICVIIPTISVIIRVSQKMIAPRKVQIEEVLTIAAYVSLTHSNLHNARED